MENKNKMNNVDNELMQAVDILSYVMGLWAVNTEIKNVIFHDPATIVYWSDGEKTVVKAEGEPFDPEKGLAMAISKRVLGNKGNYYNEFKKWLPKDNIEQENKEVSINVSQPYSEGLKISIGREGKRQ